MLAISKQPKSQLTNLVQIAREGSAQEYKKALQTRGTELLDLAVDTFFQPDREIEDARKAMAGLEELEGSFRAHLKRTRSTESQNSSIFQEKKTSIQNAHDPDIKLKPTSEETLKNEKIRVQRFSGDEKYLTDGKIANGRRVWFSEHIEESQASSDDMRGVGQFLADLAGIQGLYASVAMVPGPLSASVKTVAKEMMAAQGDFRSQHSSQHSAAAAGIIPLGVYASGGASQGSASGGIALNYDKSTVDERVIPVLMDLKDRLDQATVEPATTMTLDGVRIGREYVQHSTFFGLSNKEVQLSYTGAKERRELYSQEKQPERLWLPTTGVSEFAT